MPKITYQVQGQPSYVDMPTAGALHVLKGTTVNFKLAGPGLPVGVMPMNVAATFNMASVSTADVKNTVVTCGTASMTAAVIVYELAAVVTPLDNFAGRSLTDLGVDERVNLDVTITPPGVTAVQAGGLKWVVDGAVGTQSAGTLQKTATDKALPAHDGKAHYMAPSVMSSAALTFPANSLTPAPASLRKTVTLKLEVQGGPSKGQRITKAFVVHAPQAEMRDVRNSYQHEQNFPSAGFRGDIYLLPKNVSFKTLEWREAGGKAKAFANSNPAVPGGYFIYDHDKPHHPTGTDPGGGKFNSEVRKVGDGNLANGCWVMQVDSVWTGWNPSYPGPYTGGKHVNIATNVASTMEWPIYWQYRVAGGAGAGWNTFQKAEHKAVMAADGSVTISKAGASKAFALADGSVRF